MATVLGSPAAWSESFQGVPFPTPNFTLVFVGDTEEEEARAAASAASCGFQRSLVLEGGLQQLAAGVAQPQADLRFINRDALSVLLGMAADKAGGGGPGGVVHAPPAMLIDVRRSDERALYGAIKGAMHIPGELGEASHVGRFCCAPHSMLGCCLGAWRRSTALPVLPGGRLTCLGIFPLAVDQVASALALPPDQFAAQYRFPKPGAEDLVIFSCEPPGCTPSAALAERRLVQSAPLGARASHCLSSRAPQPTPCPAGRTNVRAGWAAQLAQDAGLSRVLVLRQGVYGWRLDPAVKPYRGYRLQVRAALLSRAAVGSPRACGRPAHAASLKLVPSVRPCWPAGCPARGGALPGRAHQRGGGAGGAGADGHPCDVGSPRDSHCMLRAQPATGATAWPVSNRTAWPLQARMGAGKMILPHRCSGLRPPPRRLHQAKKVVLQGVDLLCCSCHARRHAL